MSQSEFFQEEAHLKNTFASDPALAKHIQQVIPKAYQEDIKNHLNKAGELACGEWLQWSRQAEENKPVLTQFDPWGRRIDKISVHPAWTSLENAAATEGVVAGAYEKSYEEFSRVYQMALLYLYHPSSAFFSCPLAMTDGAARTLQLSGEKNIFSHLTSRNPKSFWTSGQWMTERTGGSDVSLTSTVAKKSGDHFELSGTKWFTSATTSQVALTLARIEGEKSLSLFCLKLRDENENLNRIEVHRLKGKLGTDALPTAELSLHGTPAMLVGNPGEGVKRIASMLNITRLYNSICAISHMRRGLDLAKDYAAKRKAFGKAILEHPLHAKTLADMETEFEKCFKLTFHVVGLLGKDETGKATEEEKKCLRALTPIVKLYTAKKCIAVISEVLECFGGAGYIENTGIPRLLRDAQVYSIWEGTTNVLALDFLRACEKDGALEVLSQVYRVKVEERLKAPEMGRELVFSVADQVIAAL